MKRSASRILTTHTGIDKVAASIAGAKPAAMAEGARLATRELRQRPG